MAETLEKIGRKVNTIYEIMTRDEQITEDEACKLLGITKPTIQVYVSNKTIPPSAYTVGIKGKRFYFKRRLMNTEDF